ncbi:MAG: hypothetical protein ABIH72_05085 [archaeon]
MNIEFIKRVEKDEILAELSENFGITSLPYLLIKTGKEKVRAYSGSLSKEEILKLGASINIEILGIYLFKRENDGLRLSFDGTSLLKDQITKSIIELNQEQAHDWLRGRDIYLKTEKQGKVILKYKDNLLGMGKLSQGRITNFVPKERRIKTP